MKKVLIIFISFWTFSCFSQQNKCSDFRTGEFKYTDPSMSTYTIERTDSRQIERDNETDVEIHTSVKWISDCEYELTYLKILNVDQDVSHIIGQKINVEIIATEGDIIQAKVKSDAMDSVLEFKKLKSP